MSPPPSAVLRQFVRLEQRRAGAGRRLGHQATRNDRRSLATASSRYPPRRATQLNYPATNTGPEPCCERQEYHETPHALATRPIRPANSLRHEQVSSKEHDAEATRPSEPRIDCPSPSQESVNGPRSLSNQSTYCAKLSRIVKKLSRARSGLKPNTSRIIRQTTVSDAGRRRRKTFGRARRGH